MSTIRDHSSHCVYLRDSPPLQPSITPYLSRSVYFGEPPGSAPPLSPLFFYADITCVSHLSHMFMFRGHMQTFQHAQGFQGYNVLSVTDMPFIHPRPNVNISLY